MASGHVVYTTSLMGLQILSAKGWRWVKGNEMQMDMLWGPSRDGYIGDRNEARKHDKNRKYRQKGSLGSLFEDEKDYK